MKRTHTMPFGAQTSAEDGTRFRLWAPGAKRVVLKSESEQGGKLQADLNEAGEGWYELAVSGMGPRTRYSYRIDDELDVPDPASRFNPDGVHGPSEVIDPAAFQWRDDAWRGRPWHEAVLYELHIGAFTREGTLSAVIPRLDELADLGISAIELLPLASFAGERGWGYDGVLPYAPHPAYGRPEDLKQFVQAAHERNLMVLLDVVYNHFGPDGNYLSRYAPGFFTDRHCTPWGDAIDFRQPAVRQFFIQNALYWLDEYHFDGLRIDAVHAIYDDAAESPTGDDAAESPAGDDAAESPAGDDAAESPAGDDSARHFIDELIETVHQGPGRERHVHIVLENHRNEARRLRAGAAQWNDDFHHPLHILLSGESDGYYIDYADRPVEHLGRVLAEGFAFQGERSGFDGELRGEPSAGLPPAAFVNFLQNHDQIGNRAFGERLAHLAEAAPLRAGLAILLLPPQIPMLFMGEEYAASQPFLYFCDFEGELAAAVSAGRRNEFAGFQAFAGEQTREQIPDPNALSTFQRSQLDRDERNQAPHAEWLRYTRSLLQIRADKVVALIPRIVAGGSTYEVREKIVTVRWPTSSGAQLVLCANLDGVHVTRARVPEGELLFSTAGSQPVADELTPWEVRLLLLIP